jgi:S1-C subfamily serine protease
MIVDDGLDQLRARTGAATVQLPTKGGQGVLVPGGFVLTAGHCVAWSLEGGMALGDRYFERIVTPGGADFRLEVLAVEPVSDIAVLGTVDGQVLPEDAMAFDEWCDETAPVRVSCDDFDLGVAVPVHILAHTRAWIRARATRYGFGSEGPDGRVWFAAEHAIESGTSGGPVIDGSGYLVGVVSFAGGTDGDAGFDGRMPRPHLALPSWIWRHIQEATAALSRDGIE